MARYYRNNTTDPEFARMMLTLAEALGVRVTEAQIRAHAQLLSDVELPDLQRAFRRAADELETGFYPTPGKLRSYIRPPAEDAAMVAWTAFGHAAAQVGAYAPVEVEDPAAATALLQAFGSWPAFCAMEDGPALALKRQEFMAAYRQARRDGARPGAGSVRLRGLLEPPPPHLATRTWIGRMSVTGAVEVVRDRPLLPGGPDQLQLSEGSN